MSIGEFGGIHTKLFIRSNPTIKSQFIDCNTITYNVLYAHRIKPARVFSSIFKSVERLISFTRRNLIILFSQSGLSIFSNQRCFKFSKAAASYRIIISLSDGAMKIHSICFSPYIRKRFFIFTVLCCCIASPAITIRLRRYSGF